MSEKGAPLGVANLDIGSKIPPALLPDLSATFATKGALVVSVKDYGAKGDGTTLDTSAVRSAYAACPAGGTLYFPPGTYLLAADGAYGPALNATKQMAITGTPGATIKAAPSAPVGTRLIQVNGNDVTVAGLSFDTNNIDDATCVFAYNAARVVVRDNYFINPGSGGLLVNDHVTDALFTGNNVTGAGYGVLVNDGLGNARLTFSHNTFNGNNQPGDGIEINGVANIMYDVVSVGNIVSNYTSTNSSVGFGIAYANVTRGTISGNIITNCGRNGIHIECLSKDISVIGNSVSDCKHAGIEVQGEFGKTCHSITVTGNTVKNCCTESSANLGRGGIEIGSSTGAPFTGSGARNIHVSGNIVDACRGAGIYLWQSNDSLITGNLVRNTYGVSTDTAHAINNVGIHSVSSTNTMFSNNRIVDTQATKTQHYPMHFYGSSGGVITMGNHLTGNIANTYDMTTGITRVLDTDDGIFRAAGVAQLGFFGKSPVNKPTGTPAAATDAATTQALVNDLRSKLLALGLIS